MPSAKSEATIRVTAINELSWSGMTGRLDQQGQIKIPEAHNRNHLIRIPCNMGEMQPLDAHFSFKARVMFLESRLRYLMEMRAAMSLPTGKRARIIKELEIVERLVDLYHRSGDA